MDNKSKHHWIILIICCGLTASSIGLCINAVGVFYTPVSESLGVLRGTFSMQSTLTMMGMAIASLFIPRIIEAAGAKRMVCIGALFTGGATILMAFANTIPVFYILGFIRGAASALYSFVPITMIITKWFDEKHGLATSITLSFSGIAGAIFSPVLASCIDAFGWRNSYVIMGVLMIVFCIPAFIYRFTFDPRDVGLLPYGYKEKVTQQTTGNTVSFRYGQWIFIAVLLFSIMITLIAQVTQHFPGFAESLGYSSQIGAMMVSAGMVGNILSKLLMGTLSDRIGAVKVTMIMLAVNSVSMILLIVQFSAAILLAAAFLYGAAYSVSAVGVTLLTRHFFGVENYGKAYPVISFALNFGGAFALSLVGYIYDFTGSYYPAFYIGLAFNAAIILLISSAVVSQRRQV